MQCLLLCATVVGKSFNCGFHQTHATVVSILVDITNQLFDGIKTVPLFLGPQNLQPFPGVNHHARDKFGNRKSNRLATVTVGWITD